jgi:hypothetical protein
MSGIIYALRPFIFDYTCGCIFWRRWHRRRDMSFIASVVNETKRQLGVVCRDAFQMRSYQMRSAKYVVYTYYVIPFDGRKINLFSFHIKNTPYRWDKVFS